MPARMIRGRPVIEIDAAPGRHHPPEPAPGRDELIDDHLADIQLRPVQPADLVPVPMRPDQYLLDHVLRAGPVTGQHPREPQQRGKPPVRELLERHRASAAGAYLLHAPDSLNCLRKPRLPCMARHASASSAPSQAPPVGATRDGSVQRGGDGRYLDQDHCREGGDAQHCQAEVADGNDGPDQLKSRLQAAATTRSLRSSVPAG
jgi:hypothetical protein